MISGSLPINIDRLLYRRTIERERVEYKAGWNPQSELPTMCAFANDFNNMGGGYIVLGLEEDNGQPILPPVGVDAGLIDKIQKDLFNLGNSAIQPNYHPLTSTYEIDNRVVFVIWVPGGETRPYKVKVSLSKKGSDWAYFIRRHSNTIRAKGSDERELLSLAATVPFDDRYQQTTSLDNFSLRLIEEFLRKTGSSLASVTTQLSLGELARRMNIVGGPSEAIFPKNVGLLFFSPKPHEFFPSTQIDVVWFPDGPAGDQFDEKEFRGPIWYILPDAISYIERNILKETVIKHSSRPEAERFWNFPIEAIEEALVNAIYHRSYEIREPVKVRISKHEIVILSFPGADRSIRMEDLREGNAVSRRYRNRRIGEFLKDLDLAEGRSTGIPKILNAMKRNGSPLPEFESDEERAWFLVRLPRHERSDICFTDYVARQADKSGVMPSKLQTYRAIPPKSEGLPLSVVRLLKVLDGEMERIELQATLGVKSRSNFSKYYLRPAIEYGLVEMTIPGKPSSPKQRYRRTVAGRIAATQFNVP